MPSERPEVGGIGRVMQLRMVKPSRSIVLSSCRRHIDNEAYVHAELEHLRRRHEVRASRRLSPHPPPHPESTRRRRAPIRRGFAAARRIGAAEAIHEALSNLQSSGHASFAKDSIIGIMASRSSPMRSEIAMKYERLYGNAEFKRGRGMKLSKLREDITETLEGEFGEVCRDMFQDGDERGADYCFLAMHGSSKDEELKAKGIAIDDGKQDNAVESMFRSGMIGSMGTDED